MFTDESDLPLCMQSDWHPGTPAWEYENRVLDAADEARAQQDLDEVDRLLALL